MSAPGVRPLRGYDPPCPSRRRRALSEVHHKNRKGHRFYTAVTYDPNNSVLRFDRSHSGFRHNIVASRKALVRYQEGEIKLRFIIDRFSVEVFVNDGEQVMTSTLYTPLNADSISFESAGSAIIDVEKYSLER